MKHQVFNIAMGSGTALVGFGVGLMAGVGAGLAVTGALVIGLTIFAARLVTRQPQAPKAD